LRVYSKLNEVSNRLKDIVFLTRLTLEGELVDITPIRGYDLGEAEDKLSDDAINYVRVQGADFTYHLLIAGSNVIMGAAVRVGARWYLGEEALQQIQALSGDGYIYKISPENYPELAKAFKEALSELKKSVYPGAWINKKIYGISVLEKEDIGHNLFYVVKGRFGERDVIILIPRERTLSGIAYAVGGHPFNDLISSLANDAALRNVNKEDFAHKLREVSAATPRHGLEDMADELYNFHENVLRASALVSLKMPYPSEDYYNSSPPVVVLPGKSFSTLAKIMRKIRGKGANITSEPFKEIATAIAGVLAYAHVLGSWHGWLSPNTVFIITQSNGKQSIQVHGFHVPGSRPDPVNVAEASVDYTDPLMLYPGMRPGPLNDTYSAALIIKEIITGEPPHEVRAVINYVLLKEVYGINVEAISGKKARALMKKYSDVVNAITSLLKEGQDIFYASRVMTELVRKHEGDITAGVRSKRLSDIIERGATLDIGKRIKTGIELYLILRTYLRQARASK